MVVRLGSLSLLVLLFSLGLVGCAGAGESTTYGADAVESSLQKHGFDVGVVFDRSKGAAPEGTVLGLLALYSELEDVSALVADASPDGAVGGEISAWVFDTTGHADSFQAGGASRLQRGNVVVLTDTAHEAAASAALDELG